MKNTALAQGCTQVLNSGTAVPEGFGAAFNLFAPQQELLIEGTACSAQGATMRFGSGGNNQYIYRQGYYWDGSRWQNLALTGTAALIGDNWYPGTAQAMLPSANQGIYVLGYICQYVNNVWRCGCHDAACTTPAWQVQGIISGQATPPASSSTPAPGQGGAYAPGATGCQNGTVNPLPPAPPQQYTVPAGATRVTSSAELSAALRNGGDIVLANGTYDSGSPFMAGSSRLWAETLGGATVTAGIQFDGQGGEVHGLKIDISQAAPDKMVQMSQGGFAGIDSSGSGLKVYDTWVTGNKTVPGLDGINVGSNDGLDIRRVVIKDMTYNGIQLGRGGDTSTTSYLSDIDIDGVIDSTSAKSRNGTGESGIWLTSKATVERVRTINTAWMGIWTGDNAADATFSDLALDTIDPVVPQGYAWPAGAHVGFYFEHMSTRVTMKCFYVGPISGVYPNTVNNNFSAQGIVMEEGSSDGNIVENGIVDSKEIGVDIGGNTNITVQNVTFKNQARVAIRDAGSGAVIQNNDYSGTAPGASHP